MSVKSGFIGSDGQVHAVERELPFGIDGYCGEWRMPHAARRVPVFMPLPEHPICNNCVREIEDEHATKEEGNGGKAPRP